jgi:molybdate transport system substrate-binding protein
MRAYIVHHGEAGFRQIAERFEAETGCRVDIRFACRTGIYDLVKRKADGDLIVSSRRAVLEELRKEGLAGGPIVPIGEVIPVIEVDKGNPKKIWTLADLARPNVRVALPAEPGCMGTMARTLLEKNKLARMVARRTVARPKGHDETAASVLDEQVDAAIIWLWALRALGSDRVQAVSIPEAQNHIEPVEAMTLTTGQNRAAAQRFLKYLQGPEAQSILADAGLVGRK